MGKNKTNGFLLSLLAIAAAPVYCWALDMDELKVDFLNGNYRRVIFEGQAELDRIHLGNTDELNYILGLSYLKELKVDQAQACFRRILNNFNSKYKDEAALALADTYLVSGQLKEAQDAYEKIIAGANTPLKAEVLYRLSQLESRRGNYQKSNDYLTSLKKDFPLNPEVKSKGITFINPSQATCVPAVQVSGQPGRYYVQVGFFTSSANAANFRDQLSAKNYPAYVESSGAGYRVKVGRNLSQEEAREMEEKLSREGVATKICPL